MPANTRASQARDRTSAGDVVVRYRDHGRRPAAVRLVTDIFKREPPRPLSRTDNGWEIRFPAPEADRVEYLLEVVSRDGARKLVTNPGAPTADAPFGQRSVLELPGYVEPRWLRTPAPSGGLQSLQLRSGAIRATVTGLLWSPPGADPAEPLPLLVVHDGPEYAKYSGLVRFLEVAAATGSIPLLRAALLAPVERDEHYSASARYSLALRRDLLPQLAERAPTPAGRDNRAGMGASLGALALLHVHRRHPDAFGALFLQSGSFFRRRQDSVEARFSRFERIVRFVASVRRPVLPEDCIPIAFTCGKAEENLGSNRALVTTLAAQGYPVTLAETRDAHNWVSWRDALDPHLTKFLARAFG